jgi:Asp-tRNA(Asn)/Glu-tRNA(Gln) amidotransferase A subunit family amidase
MTPTRSTRRSFLQSSGAALFAISAAGRRLPAQGNATFDVTEKSIRELQAALTAGHVTSAQLVELYLARIAAYDQTGPTLNAVIALNPEAGADARDLDDERKARGPRGPLHGIPVLLKDNFETEDMPTTGGSLALRGIVPAQDAFQVRGLRRAGAIVLGKVNLHELALGLTTHSSLGGQTLNPYDLTRAPGGSSGGSGVAAAACFAAFTMGTDTSGSIRIPSSHNSIVGLRPSAGLSSRAGIIPFGHTQDTGGPMARTVEDLAVILDATVGYDPADPTTVAGSGRIPRTYTSSLKAGALKGTRIGVLTEFFGNAPEDGDVAAVVRRAIDEMRTAGATAVDVAVPDLARLITASNLLTQEVKFYLRDYLRSAGAHARSIEELLDSGLHSASLQGILGVANAVPEDYTSGDDYKSRLAARGTLAKAVVSVMDANRLDAVVYPTVRRIGPVVGGPQAGSNAALSANSGLPAVTVPAGFTVQGFPVGIELLGRSFAEPTLLSLAFDFEQATHHRRPPAATPALAAGSRGPALRGPADVGPGAVTITVTATGARSLPSSNVPFQAIARLSFNEQTRQLGYDLRLSGSLDEVAGVYLHRRANRQNGGVAYVLAKSSAPQIAGVVTLTEAEVADLKAGNFYMSVLSAKNPRLGARADLALPSA